MNAKVRTILGGLALLAAGAAIAYFEIYQPYETMSQHGDNITISDKGALLGPFIVFMGLGLLFAGLFTTPLSPNKHSRAGNWIIGIFAVIGIAAGGYVAFKWLPDQETKFGYYTSR